VIAEEGQLHRVYEDSWDALSKWIKGTHSSVSERMLELLEPLTTTTRLVAMYCDRDSHEERSYSCVLATNGWVHELEASIPDGAVKLESWPLSHVENLKIEISGVIRGSEKYSVAFLIKEGRQFQWDDEVNLETGPGSREHAKSALRFVTSLRGMLSPL